MGAQTDLFPDRDSDVGGANRLGRISGLVAMGSVFALPVTVDAAVVYSGLKNLTVGLPVGSRAASGTVPGANVTGLRIDIDDDLFDDIQLTLGQVQTGAAKYALVIGAGSSAGLVMSATTGGGPSVIANLPFGKTIAYGSGLWSSGGVIRGVVEAPSGRYEVGMKPGAPAILGFSFTRAGGLHFGWLRLMLEDGPGGFPVSLTVLDWAWEDEAFAGIRAGHVPEANPALAMLAAAGTGLAAWRLRKRQQGTGQNG